MSARFDLATAANIGTGVRLAENVTPLSTTSGHTLLVRGLMGMVAGGVTGVRHRLGSGRSTIRITNGGTESGKAGTREVTGRQAGTILPRTEATIALSRSVGGHATAGMIRSTETGMISTGRTTGSKRGTIRIIAWTTATAATADGSSHRGDILDVESVTSTGAVTSTSGEVMGIVGRATGGAAATATGGKGMRKGMCVESGGLGARIRQRAKLLLRRWGSHRWQLRQLVWMRRCRLRTVSAEVAGAGLVDTWMA